MKKGRFLWSAHRITEKPKAGKARNIKEKQLKNSRNTASKAHAVHRSSPRDNRAAFRFFHFKCGRSQARLSDDCPKGGLFMFPLKFPDVKG